MLAARVRSWFGLCALTAPAVPPQGGWCTKSLKLVMWNLKWADFLLISEVNLIFICLSFQTTVIFCFSQFVFNPHLRGFFLREREEVRERNMRVPKGDQTCNLDMCPEWGSNPQPFDVWDSFPTNWATWPGLFLQLSFSPVENRLWDLKSKRVRMSEFFFHFTTHFRCYVLVFHN